MAQQLVLLDSEADHFRLDDRTREIGRRGVAEVRRVLSEKARRDDGAAVVADRRTEHSAAA